MKSNNYDLHLLQMDYSRIRVLEFIGRDSPAELTEFLQTLNVRDLPNLLFSLDYEGIHHSIHLVVLLSSLTSIYRLIND